MWFKISICFPGAHICRIHPHSINVLVQRHFIFLSGNLYIYIGKWEWVESEDRVFSTCAQKYLRVTLTSRIWFLLSFRFKCHSLLVSYLRGAPNLSSLLPLTERLETKICVFPIFLEARDSHVILSGLRDINRSLLREVT